jgi:ferritin-like metal-binding protein YciE
MQLLPDMIETAHDLQLKQRLHSHLGETINHTDRLEDVFSLYGTDPRHLHARRSTGSSPRPRTWPARQTSRRSTPRSSPPRRRSSIYEIARYGSLVAWAKRLEREDCAAILEQNLKEEQAVDQLLAELAERDANLRAA